MKILRNLPILALLVVAAPAAVVLAASVQERGAEKPAPQEPAAGAAQEKGAAKPAPASQAKKAQQGAEKKEADGEVPALEKVEGSRWAPKKVVTVDLTQIPVEEVPLVEGAQALGTRASAPGSLRPADYDPASAPRPQVTIGGEEPKGTPFRAESDADVRITFEEGADTWDFGDLMQGETPSHTFVLKAEGTDDLVIKRIKASCGCTLADTTVVTPSGERQAWQENQAIAPGSTIEVKTSLKTDGKRNSTTTNVAIYSNDSQSAVRRLTLRANVRAVVEVEPTSLNFGQVMAHEETSGVITLTSAEDQPFALTLAEERGLEDLDIELVPIEPGPDGRSHRWEARLQLGPGLKEGIKNFPLRFKTDIPIKNASPRPDGEAPTHEYRAYAIAQVQGMIYAKPNYCAFGMMRPGEVQARTYTIYTRDEEFEFPEDPAVRVQALKNQETLQIEDYLSVTTTISPDKKALQVDVTVSDLPEDFEGSFNGFVEVDVGHPMTETVRTRFTGIARPGVASPTRGG